MKEIGGYIELETFKGKEYYDYPSFNLARNCLEHLIHVKQIKKIYLPYYCCDCIEKICFKSNVIVEYYHIDNHFNPLLDENVKLANNDYIYIINFFGFLSNEDLRKIKDTYHHIIIDNSQSFFQEPLTNAYTIYNCRKYFGVPDGAYLYTLEDYPLDYDQAISCNRMLHLLGRFEKNGSDFFPDYVENEKRFDNFNVQLMSKITKNILRAIDYNEIKNKRINNYNYINSKLSHINKLSCKNDCTFMYPLLIKDGYQLRKILIENKVYIPILWPNLDEHPLNDFEKDLFLNLVPLPIDHRYDMNDMEHVINLIVRSDKNGKS